MQRTSYRITLETAIVAKGLIPFPHNNLGCTCMHVCFNQVIEARDSNHSKHEKQIILIILHQMHTCMMHELLHMKFQRYVNN